MRRSALLFLCSLPPGGALVAGCFGHDGGSGNGDASFTNQNDASFSQDVTAPIDAPADHTADAPDDVLGDVAEELPADTGSDGPIAGQFPTGKIDFGLVGCGSAPAASKTYSFTNTGAAPVTYSASIGPGTIFGIQGASSGTVDPGATGTLTLVASVVPTSSTAGTALTGTLMLTTNVPGFASVNVPLALTPQGASFTVSPATVAFGPQQLGLSSNLPVVVTNVGNAPATVTLGAPTDAEFGVVYTGAPAAVTLAPGDTLPSATVTFLPVGTAGAKSGSAAIQTTSPTCASAQTAVAMTGAGSTAPVNVGPGTLDFLLVSCGTGAAGQQVLITNGYSTDITYSAVFGSGANYTMSAASGTVPGTGQAMLLVTPNVIAVPGDVTPGAYDDTLTVTTSAPQTTPTTIALKESALGAILTASMPSTGFGPVTAGSTGNLPFTVTNTGNLDAPLTLVPTGAGFGGVFTGSSTAAGSGGMATGNATFSPLGLGMVSGSLQVTTPVALCGPAPAALPLTATGTGPVASFPSTGAALGVTCGRGASTVQSVAVTNTGTTNLDVVTAKSVDSSFVIVTPLPTGIAPGKSGNIQYQAPAPVYNMTLAGSSTDTLEFTTNEAGSPPHDVSIPVTVTGANFVLVDGAGNVETQVQAPVCRTTVTYAIKNTGNQSATFQESYPTTTSSFVINSENYATGAPIAAGGTGAFDSVVIKDWHVTAPACVGTITSGTVNATGAICAAPAAVTYVLDDTSAAPGCYCC